MVSQASTIESRDSLIASAFSRSSMMAWIALLYASSKSGKLIMIEKI